MTIDDLLSLSARLDFKACTGHGVNKRQDWQKTVSLSYKPSDDGDESEVDLSVFTATGEVREYTGAETLVATMTCTTEGNKIHLTLPKSVTASIEANGKSPSEYTRYRYDVILTDGVKSARIIQGCLDVIPGVTKEE